MSCRPRFQLFKVFSALLFGCVLGCASSNDLDVEILTIASSGQLVSLENASSESDSDEVTLWKKEPMLEYSRNSGSGGYTFLLTRSRYAGLQVIVDGTRATYVSRLSESQADHFLSVTREIIRNHDSMFEQGKSVEYGTSAFSFFGTDGEVGLEFSVIHDSKRESDSVLSLKSLIVRTLLENPWVRFDRALEPG